MEDNIVENLASSDQAIAERAASQVTERVRHDSDAGDRTNSLKRVLQDAWIRISPDRRNTLVGPLTAVVLEGQSPLATEIAAAALATQGDDGLNALLDHIDHPDSRVRRNVATSLGLLGSSARHVIPVLLSAAATEGDRLVREALVLAMSRIDDPALFPSLIELLTLMAHTPDADLLSEQVFAAVRDRRQREWPEANKPRTG